MDGGGASLPWAPSSPLLQPRASWSLLRAFAGTEKAEENCHLVPGLNPLVLAQDISLDRK